MALTDDQLAQLDGLLATAESPSTVVRQFRQQFPGVSVTSCDLSDLGGETPFRQYQSYSIFLVDRSDHCWRITCDVTRASGIVLAQHKAAV